MDLLNNISKSMGVCSMFKFGNPSWSGTPFGTPVYDLASIKLKTHTRRIKANTFDFGDTLKVL